MLNYSFEADQCNVVKYLQTDPVYTCKSSVNDLWCKFRQFQVTMVSGHLYD